MNSNASALVYLGSHNEVDQISPIIYKLGERNNISVDVILDGLNEDRLDTTERIDLSDYRIQAVNQHDNITFTQQDSRESQFVPTGRLITSLKNVGWRVPTDVPQKVYRGLRKLYNSFSQSNDYPDHKKVHIPDELADNEYDVLAFDWEYARRNKTDITSIVLPHGDSPYVNPIIKQRQFDPFINDRLNFNSYQEIPEIGYYQYERLLGHDYFMFPNRITADRMPQSTPSNKIAVCGSPRYNTEWLDILSKIRPKAEISVDNEINIVFFLRSENNVFITKSEIENTLLLLNKFEGISTIVKEHPRGRLLERTAADDMKNVSIVANELTSPSLIQWGDVFLSVGTTITFEPIMREKPVIGVEYAHANYSVVSDYFPNSDMRYKEQLYDTIFNLLKTGTDNYYNVQHHQTFVNEMILPTNSSVLDSWAKFIESKAQ
jgi:hypothetical protein